MDIGRWLGIEVGEKVRVWFCVVVVGKVGEVVGLGYRGGEIRFCY